MVSAAFYLILCCAPHPGGGDVGRSIEGTSPISQSVIKLFLREKVRIQTIRRYTLRLHYIFLKVGGMMPLFLLLIDFV